MITFKKASKNDIPLIQNLAEKSWKSAYSEILSEQQIEYMLNEMYSATEISNHLQNPNYYYYLIFDHETVVGFLGF